MGRGGPTVPLTPFQAELGRLLAANRSEDSYLAGAAPLLVEPRSLRYSHDLDYFQDSEARVASAFDVDRRTLQDAGFELRLELSQPGYVRALVRHGPEASKVEWAYDSSWRFVPVIRSDAFGFQLHPVDLAVNKVLALAGRDEPRDLIDTLYCHAQVLTLGALVWAAPGKDPGYSPRSLLEQLRRRGRVGPDDLRRLHLAEPVDLKHLKAEWLAALGQAEAFLGRRPPEEAGCLYYAAEVRRFVDPDEPGVGRVVPHYGAPGGVVPRFLPSSEISQE